MSDKDVNFGERRRDALAKLIERRMAYAEKFFGVGKRPYGTKAVSDAEGLAMYGQMTPQRKIELFPQLTPEDQAKIKQHYGGGETGNVLP